MDVSVLAPEQLRTYAAGYTDALEDVRPELEELRTLALELGGELQRARVVADAVYHDAYCGCHKKITDLVLTATAVRNERNKDNRP